MRVTIITSPALEWLTAREAASVLALAPLAVLAIYASRYSGCP